ncbi:ribonucleoside triphosphate reductase [Candidatus Micrarchaeota archaeon]|nr:ribonucleoside triphosphate reductase [Candidatus Micrarchaeota archaeon]
MVDRNKISLIKRRDGETVLFNKNRIIDAIWKAFRVTGEGDKYRAEILSDQVLDILSSKVSGIPTVEQVQDIVEEVLIINKLVKTAKAYILYRRQHEELREMGHLITNVDAIDKYLTKKDWNVKENANMTYSLQGLNTFIASNIIRQYWLYRIYTKDVRNAHTNGDIHIHDLNTLGAYCVGWDLQDLLLTGFKGVPGKIQSAPASHLSTAFGQIVNYIYTLQGETAGAQAFSNFDTYLAPFIRYDGLDYKGLKRVMRSFLFNMNVPTRTGFQTPFSNITLDINVPDFMKNEPVIINGKPTGDVYSDFTDEIDMFNQVFAEVMTEGDAVGRVFTFPIPTYNITKDFDWDSPSAQKIFEMTAKYGIPYFSNFVNSDMKPEDARSMCCRLRLDNRELRKRGGGLFGANPLTGSIGVVTINMPRLGYLSKNEDEFFERLVYLMDLAYSSLQVKRKVIEKFTENDLYPYSKFYLRNVKKATGGYWTNHFSTIGLVGMNEMALNLLGEDLLNEDARRFVIKVMMFMRQKLVEYQIESGDNYNLEATPAEGTSYRLALLDKKLYPSIITANEDKVKNGAPPYYTNSSQLHVSAPLDLFEALELQDELQTLYTGGTVFHSFLGERISDWKMAAELVKKIANNFKLPYFTLSPTFSVCPIHGYIKGEHKKCPKCDMEIGYSSLIRSRELGEHVDEERLKQLEKKRQTCEVYSRVVGYLRPVSQWNEGKQSEFDDRRVFDSD